MCGDQWGAIHQVGGKKMLCREKRWKSRAGRKLQCCPSQNLNLKNTIRRRGLCFSRDSKAEESFAIRNHKYQAPVVIFGPARK